MKNSCVVCGAAAHGRGLCRRHYLAAKRHDTRLDPALWIAGEPCSVDGCQRMRRTRGLCGMHEQRFRRHGDPLAVTPEEVRRFNLHVAHAARALRQSHTYPKIMGRHAHRVVAEAKLGRPLERDEVVHHRNGMKDDFLPDNIEVMTRAAHCREHLPELILARKMRAEERRAAKAMADDIPM